MSVTVNGETKVVSVEIQGIQGIQGQQGSQGIQGIQGPSGDGVDIDITNAIEGSVLTFDQSNNKVIANNVNTITSLVDGGNF